MHPLKILGAILVLWPIALVLVVVAVAAPGGHFFLLGFLAVLGSIILGLHLLDRF